MPWFTGEHGVVDGHITVSSGRLDLTDFMTQRSDDLHSEVVVNGAAVLTTHNTETHISYHISTT